jgi:4-amino-4-deoxy-L-arabinose transferase-like glycosyltransferase
VSGGHEVGPDTPTALPRLRPWLVAHLPLILLGILVVVLLVANAVWLWSNRHNGSFNIDEAGYLGFSLDDYYALRRSGPVGLARAVLRQPTYAPLVPALSALAYLGAGRVSLLGAFAVQLLAYALVVVTTYSIGRLLVDRWAALVAAFAVAATPAMVVYSHDYSYAVPAAAAAMVAIWGALRSDLLTRKRFAIVWGVALGAMVITRTMTIAFVPSFALLGALQVVASRRRRSSLAGLACGFAAAVVVAGPWYAAQGSTVWTYLTSFGYGAASAGYGAARPLFSPSAWLPYARDNVNQYLWLPLTLVVLAGAVALAALVVVKVVRRELSLRTVIASPWFYLLLVLAEGVVALMSSRNRGSGFLLPLLPVLVLLAVVALAKATQGHRPLGYAVMGVIVVLCLPSLIATTALNTTGRPIATVVPGLGSMIIVDARGPYVLYAVQQNEFDAADPEGLAWRRANDSVVAAVHELSGAGPHLLIAFAFEHSLLNVNTIGLEEILTDGGRPTIYGLTQAHGVAGYAKELDTLLGTQHGVVLVSSDSRGMFPPLLDQEAMRQALARSGFAKSRTVALPDGADVELWVR